MKLIDADGLKKHFTWSEVCRLSIKEIEKIIDSVPTVAQTNRPFICINGMVVYITQGHIDALIEYERTKKEKEFLDNLRKSLDMKIEIKTDDIPSCINCVHHIDDVCEHCYEINVNWCTSYRSAGDKQ